MKNKYMELAIIEAKKALDLGEIPIGAVIICDDIVIASGFNQKEKYKNPLKHAEIIVIEQAIKRKKNWRLNDCEIYITLEPCPMCASAIKQSRIKKVYYGSSNGNKNNFEIMNKIFSSNDNNGVVAYEKGVMEKECTELIQSFFKNRRNDK